ncbi:response regulator [Dyadobacter frigoris]|uniref:Response regulator n=1 Tax=Dyadobacter frigoris TaxID=2576211 RepID=A0A4U6D0W5_9BACT|nr:response regulator [Dyadobacter frigoris]TKT90829.1 response regulator [Dyadobacter frigoris]GLU52165.1 response regulator [Dyadobacter frigoris]
MRSIHILLVEDNEGDILLTTEALQEGRVLNKISVVRDGQEAIDFLNRKGKHTLAEQPDLVLLDVNLPKKNGHEVLQYIKKSDDIKHIPVIMLTTSSSERDISLSYQNHANCYITKPVELEGFLNVVTQIENFWISIVALPSVNKN